MTCRMATYYSNPSTRATNFSTRIPEAFSRHIGLRVRFRGKTQRTAKTQRTNVTQRPKPLRALWFFASFAVLCVFARTRPFIRSGPYCLRSYCFFHGLTGLFRGVAGCLASRLCGVPGRFRRAFSFLCSRSSRLLCAFGCTFGGMFG